MVKNLGGEWEPGCRIVDSFVASVPDDSYDFSVRWGSGKSGGTTLFFDLGWFNRGWSSFQKHEGGYYQIGLNQICWIPERSNLKRWKRLNLQIIEGRHGQFPGMRVLGIGQVENDAQHGLSYGELDAWMDTQKRYLDPREYRFRPHPQGSQGKPERSLEADLDWADIVLTYNSTVGLEALRLGIPVVCSSNCFYRELCNRPRCPSVREREAFFGRVADAQWTEAEIADGTAFEFYRKYL